MKSARIFASVGMLALPFFTVAAEPRAKKERSSSERTPAAPRAEMRVWKDMLPSQRNLRVIYRAGARRAAPVEVRLASDGWQFLDYMDVIPGPALIEISDDAEPKKKLLTIPATLRPGAFATLLVHEDNGKISAQLLSDDNTSNRFAELTVRNFVPTLSTLQIAIGEDLNARLQSPESFLHVRGLPRKTLQILTTGSEQSGKPMKWTNEVDFSKVRRATILVYPDSHGRIRPRVAVDGEMPPRAPAEGDEPGPPR